MPLVPTPPNPKHFPNLLSEDLLQTEVGVDIPNGMPNPNLYGFSRQDMVELYQLAQTAAEDGQALVWSDSEGRYVPADVSGGGGGAGGFTVEVTTDTRGDTGSNQYVLDIQVKDAEGADIAEHNTIEGYMTNSTGSTKENDGGNFNYVGGTAEFLAYDNPFAVLRTDAAGNANIQVRLGPGGSGDGRSMIFNVRTPAGDVKIPLV